MKPKDQLIWGAIANAKNTEFANRPLWAVVRDIFGCGATMATDLCRKHNFDPDKQMPPIVCPTCERDLIYIWGTEDETIVLNNGEGWHDTLWATCPEQAKGFYEHFRHDSYHTTKEWEDALDDFQAGWEPTKEQDD